ncbi:MAG: RNA polymerase subunit sigma-70, partial [Proteobacteria bacterium]|nr:RNA polymerase subunit sigma-70 [Pseudomonadota bacterium]
AAVHQLPLSLRQVLTLALEELAHREIAEVLGISENAVAIRFYCSD